MTKNSKGTFTKTKKHSDRWHWWYKILVSKKESYGTKNAFQYFIGYNDNVIRPLCVRLVQMTGYARKFVENTTMSFRAINK